MNYQNLLSPIKIRGHVVRNRMEATVSMPHFSQGPERYPGEEIIRHFIGRAKNGAGIVTVSGVNGELGMPPIPQDSDVSHFPKFDMYDPECQNYFVHLTEALHSLGAVASMCLVPASNKFPYFNERGEMELVSGSAEGTLPVGWVSASKPKSPEEYVMIMDEIPIGDEISADTLEKIAASHGQQAAQLKFLGFDMITLHMSYRAVLMGKFLSPLTNRRTDDFGGGIEGRAKFPLMVLKSIREAAGPDFIIEFHVSGVEPEGGNTTDDVIAFLRMAEEYADIAQIRAARGDPNHPTGFNLEKTPMLAVTEKIKKSGVRILIANVGGWLDPEHADTALREGKLDIISMARAWISNPNYGELVYQGRNEDIVPCVRCNRCHGRGPNDVYATACTVNPVLGQERLHECMTVPVSVKKSVAVIGGGPGGMKAAIILADRGHNVTLFDETDRLGGMLRHTDFVNFKWPLRDYKNYLIAQLEKRGVNVKLNTRVDAAALCGKFDAVVAAVGAKYVKPKIPGIDAANVITATEALEDISRVGKTAVVIGGGEVGIETGMYMAQEGRTVTVLEMCGKIAAEATKIHYYSMLEEAWLGTKGLTAIVNATVMRIEHDSVVYRDKDGAEQTVPADTVVICTGLKPNTDEALSFYGAADSFYMIGDCHKQGTVQTTNRSAYYTANLI